MYMKTTCVAVVLATSSLVACKSTGDFTESSSALDPVGLAHHKREAAKLASEAKFKPNEQITLRNTQVMVFDKNPQRYTTGGEVVSASTATVVKSEGLFVRVKFDDGKTGYINESDIVDPMENFGFGYGTEMMPAFLTDEGLPLPAGEMPPGVLPPVDALPATGTPDPVAVPAPSPAPPVKDIPLPVPSNKQ